MDTDIPLSTCIFCIAAIIILLLLVERHFRSQTISNITDKYVLITGCDRGFGEAAALSLSQQCHVIAGCLTSEGCQRLRDVGGACLSVVHMDVTDMKSVETAYHQVQAIVPAHKGLWGLVNNAGLSGKLGPVDWLQYDDITHVVNVNVLGMIMTTKVFLPLIKVSKGRIVNTSSILGHLSLPYNGVYSMSKHAVESISDSLRLELAPFGIRVSIVEPGTHYTNFVHNLDSVVDKAWHDLPTHVQQEYGQKYHQKILFLTTRFIPILGLGSKVDNVVKTYEHALLSKYPKSRYLVGLDAKLLYVASLLPTWLMDIALTLPGLRAIPDSCRRK